MATKYAAKWNKDGEREAIALFSDEVPHEVLIDFADSAWVNSPNSVSCVYVLDMDTGEIIHHIDGYGAVDNCDNDCGFDPFIGSYTDDC